MSTVFLLKDNSYEDLNYLELEHQVIDINLAQLQGVPRGSIVFTHNYAHLEQLIARGMKIIYNPRNSLSPSVIADLSYIDYNRSIQYVGSSLVQSYLKTYLEPLYNKWNSRFEWYDKDEQVGKILGETPRFESEYDAVIFTQSQILPRAYATYLNNLSRSGKYAVVFHPKVTPDFIDALINDLDVYSSVSTGYETILRTGLRGSITLVHDSMAKDYQFKSKLIMAPPGQIAAETSIYMRTGKTTDVALLSLPKALIQSTNTKLGTDLSSRFSIGMNQEYQAGMYRDGVLEGYDISGTPESHIKPYRKVLEDVIAYYS